MQPKRIYFVDPHPSLAPGAFTARWREHGRLAMAFMARQDWRNVVRYVHCDAVDVPGVANAWAGMGIVVFRDAQARKDHIASPGQRLALEADEDLAFSQRVSRCGLVAREEVVVDGPADGLKLVRVWGKGQAPRPRPALGDGLVRYVLDWPLEPENGSAWGLACSVVEEMWFERAEDIADLLGGDDDRRAVLFELAVRETTLYPPPLSLRA